MTLQEFYNQICGDYDEVKLRLPTDDFILRFINKFEQDTTFENLLDAIKSDDIKQSFEYAHKFKGIVANLSFTNLYLSTSKLCEQLRSLDKIADKELVNQVAENYKQVIASIKQLRN